ncbi:MAG: peptidoglycan DD-metalloendopeptidase family protein [Bacteroidales bacterium]|nr:peptidoglycan DD-metalloendopeptidase family protein [Bacteroidales bacterium]
MQFQTFKKFIIIAVLSVSVFPAQAQTVKELENQRKQTLQLLESTNKMLNETKKSQRSTLNKLTIINKNINERKTLIKNISVEINELDSEMGRLNQETRTLDNRLEKLKADYAKLVQEAHIHRSIYAKIMFVLSAESFDQSYRRFRYLKEYTDYRKHQIRQIDNVKTQIVQKSDSLNKHRNTKVEVVKQKEIEATKLTKDQKKEKVLLTDLQKKEKKLRTDLKLQQKKANDLNNKIANKIAEEIRKAEAKRAAEEKKRLAEEKKKSTTTSNKETTATKSETSTADKRSATTESLSTLTKEEKLISGNFSSNAGRLPWPTDKGFISGRYGVHPHPVLKHVTTNNKGIYIQTPAGTNARVVFEGVVTQRFSIPGSNNAVIVKHGDYRTVYANLTSIYVNVGDKVSAKQSIGKIYTDGDNDNKTELYFQLWKGRSLLNPENWITQ